MLMMLIAIISAAWNTPKYSLYGFNTKAFQWKKNNLKIPTYYLFCRNYIWFEINILFNRKENKLFQLLCVGLNNYQKIVKYIIDRDNNFPSIKVGSVQIFSNIRIIEKENFEPGRLVLKSINQSINQNREKLFHLICICGFEQLPIIKRFSNVWTWPCNSFLVWQMPYSEVSISWWIFKCFTFHFILVDL